MGDVTIGTDEANPRFGVEQRGIEFIPESERGMSVRQLALFWVGSSLYPFNVLLGVLAFGLGLPAWAAILVCIIGALGYVYPAFGSIAGARSGMATYAVSRATFGINPGRINALFAWLTGIAYEVINVIVAVFAGVALLTKIGWSDPGDVGTVIALIVVYGISVALPYLGHATMVYVQQFFAVLLAIVSILVFVYLLGDLDLGAKIDSGIPTWSAWLIALGITFSGSLAYVITPCDYTRYLPSKTSGRSIFWTVLIAAGAPAAFLGVVGVLMAAQGGDALGADPIGNATAVLPDLLFVLWLIAAIGGSIANLSLTMYSASLAAQATGLPLKRYQATVVDAIIATVGIVYILFIDDATFLTWLGSIVVFVIIWIGPYGAIWLIDLAWRGYRVTPEQVHAGAGSAFWGLTGPRTAAWISLVAGMIAAWLTISVPKYTGPIAEALEFTDVNWLAGPIVAGVLYLILGRAAVRREVSGG